MNEEDEGILEEKLTELIMTSEAKEYLENFKKFKLTKENISLLEEKINSANLYISSNIDKGNKRILKHFKICPEYTKFFKFEKDEKSEKEPKKEEVMDEDWRRLLPSQWREIFQNGVIPDYVSIVSEFALLNYISRMSALQAIKMLKQIINKKVDERPMKKIERVIKKDESNKGICEVAVEMHDNLERGYHEIGEKLYPNIPMRKAYDRAKAAVRKGRDIKLKKMRDESIVVT